MSKMGLRWRLAATQVACWHFRCCWWPTGPWCRLMEWVFWHVGVGPLLLERP